MTNTHPLPWFDYRKLAGLCDEPVPGIAIRVNDRVVAVEHAVVDLVAMQIGSDVLDRVQLRTTWKEFK